MFHMNLTVPKKDETKDVMHFRIKLNLVSEEDWRFAQNLTTRIHRTDAFHLLNESRQVCVKIQIRKSSTVLIRASQSLNHFRLTCRLNSTTRTVETTR